MTYDPWDQNKNFVERENIDYPILSDPQAQLINKLGIRNLNYGPDSPAFNVPLPGIMYIAPDEKIQLKRAIEDYRERPSFDQLYEAVSDLIKDAAKHEDDSEVGD